MSIEQQEAFENTLGIMYGGDYDHVPALKTGLWTVEELKVFYATLQCTCCESLSHVELLPDMT